MPLVEKLCVFNSSFEISISDAGVLLSLSSNSSFDLFFFVTVQALVEEKETRAKETMYIMGLKSWVFSISWATTYLVRSVQFLFCSLFFIALILIVVIQFLFAIRLYTQCTRDF
jgi:hypothetical protein